MTKPTLPPNPEPGEEMSAKELTDEEFEAEFSRLFRLLDEDQQLLALSIARAMNDNTVAESQPYLQRLAYSESQQVKDGLRNLPSRD